MSVGIVRVKKGDFVFVVNPNLDNDNLIPAIVTHVHEDSSKINVRIFYDGLNDTKSPALDWLQEVPFDNNHPPQKGTWHR